MKPKLTLALVALITGTAFGSMPAVLPEFKNAKQLAEWRAEMAANSTPQTTATEEHAFYTGKPYIESSGGYAFKYRSYNPELARWTSEDPSGFPDGANGNLYAPRPTSGIDPYGLDAVTVTGTPEADISGNPLSIRVVQKAKQVTGTIAASLDISWEISGDPTGWIVQRIEFDVSKVYKDSDNSLFTLSHPPTAVYWEAWRVTSGNIERGGADAFITPAFPESTHGEMMIAGKAQYYSDSSFSLANGPYGWSRDVAEAGGLRSITTAPSWWTGSGLDHNLKMTWE